MSNVSIAGYAGWPAYDTFLIVSLLGRPVYDPNPLRPNPNPKKSVSGSCRVRGLGRTLTPLYMRKDPLSLSTQKNWDVYKYQFDNKRNLCITVLRALLYTSSFLYGCIFLFTKWEISALNRNCSSTKQISEASKVTTIGSING